ncbi:MAG: N-acetyltransferase [Actinobacteria bacterium]|nr:N-acetyltransferase [Actinomycetota bacterium]NBY15821.1 N-acetyltransferase [Actinomycetota bacterium]
MTTAWPVRLRHEDLILRPLRLRDYRAWRLVRSRNQDWLRRWEATSPYPELEQAPSFSQSTRSQLRGAKAGQGLPFVLIYQGEFVGQINVSSISQGSLWSCHIGYWIDERVANRGLMTTAVALVSHYLFTERSIHRIEIAIRPENAPSNRLVQKLGFQLEGIRKSFIHIDGAWRDHNVYVMFQDEISDALLRQINLI